MKQATHFEIEPIYSDLDWMLDEEYKEFVKELREDLDYFENTDY